MPARLTVRGGAMQLRCASSSGVALRTQPARPLGALDSMPRGPALGRRYFRPSTEVRDAPVLSIDRHALLAASRASVLPTPAAADQIAWMPVAQTASQGDFQFVKKKAFVDLDRRCGATQFHHSRRT